MNKILLLIPLMLLSGCSLQKESIVPEPAIRVRHIEQFTVKDSMTSGIYYALPRTGIHVDIEVVRKDFTKGPYAQYALRYLGLTVPQSNSSTFDIAAINISTFTEPDPKNFYFVEMPQGSPLVFELSESGLIVAFNEVTGSELTDVGEFRSAGLLSDRSAKNEIIPGFNLVERIDTIVEAIGGDSMQTGRTVVRRTLVEKSLEQKAKEAADEINKIQESKMNLLTGFHEVNFAPETIRFMYEQLDKIEQDLISMFTGYHSSSRKQYRYSYIPDEGEFERTAPIFRFSRQAGLLSPDQEAGEYIYLHLKRTSDNQKIAAFEASSGGHDNTGLAYRIPESASLRITKGNEVLADARFLINQFGVVAHLSPDFKSVRFYPTTGSIKTIE